jgi:hypothetical protein
MYSVVIPTMWNCSFFPEFLADLLEFPAVGQVIVINNNIEKMPANLPMTHPKFKMMVFGTNIGVNPAWNIGVRESTYDKVCIANDDVVFDSKIFNRVDTVLNPDSGVVGICPGVKEFNQPPFEAGIGRVIPWTGQHTYGFGCLMFVHKSWYRPVPDGLKIYYGDNWIFDTCLLVKRTNYLVTDTFFYTPFATTTGKLTNVGELHQLEQPIYNQAIADFRNEIKENQELEKIKSRVYNML